MSMSDKTYDALKLAQKIFLVIAAFYSKLAEIWALPFGDEVSETCLAIAAVLLGILEAASAVYNKKQISEKDVLIEQAKVGEEKQEDEDLLI